MSLNRLVFALHVHDIAVRNNNNTMQDEADNNQLTKFAEEKPPSQTMKRKNQSLAGQVSLKIYWAIKETETESFPFY
jgi:hypothetical protein